MQQLRDAGVTAEFVSGDGTNDPQFVEQAGEASKDAILTCPCGPAPDDFAATYETEFNIAPGVYSVDAYDLATIMVTGIDSEGKVTDRAGMIEFFKTYDGQGVARPTSGTPAVSSPSLIPGSTRSSSSHRRARRPEAHPRDGPPVASSLGSGHAVHHAIRPRVRSGKGAR